MKNSLFITNLDRCLPAEALSGKWQKNCWRIVDYETMSDISGKMLMGTQDSTLQEIHYPLGLKGWYRIFLGLGNAYLNPPKMPMLKVKLSSDPCYTRITPTLNHWWMEIDDCLWKEADLTGELIHFMKEPNNQSYIAYVRLEPMSEQEINKAKQIGKENPSLFMAGTNDSYEIYNTIEELYEGIIPMRGSDLKKMFFCIAGGDISHYMPTTIGTMMESLPCEDFPRTIDKKIVEGYRRLNQKYDVIEKVCSFSHEIGIEFHASFRVGAFACEPPFDELFISDFYRKNPGFHCRDYDGREISRLSYAWPEVQEHMLSFYEESLRYDIDGINLIFIRSLPLMLYETPLLEGFEKCYGRNPLTLKKDDPSFLEYRAGIITDFIRKIRNKMDQAGKRKKLELSVIVPANADVNKYFGLDLKTWIDEELVDIILPDFSLQTTEHNENPVNLDIGYYSDLVKGTNCRLLPRLQGFPPAQIEKSIEYINKMIKAGANGVFLWDTVNYTQQAKIWEYLRNGCCPEFAEKLANGKFLKRESKVLFKSLAGFTSDKHPTHISF